MKILIVHNEYRATGGEKVVAESEAELLREHGEEVREYRRSNAEIRGMGESLMAPIRALWASDAAQEIEQVLDTFSPDVVHFHNTWLRISPAAYWAVKKHGIPVVQTLHNYRLLCPNAQFLRDGAPCELCKERRFPTPGVRHQCYRDSAVQTALVGATTAVHDLLGTWDDKIDRYIVLTEFARRKFLEGGFEDEVLSVKPNFTSDPGVGTGDGGYALFVGRISNEKGPAGAVEAWREFDIPLPLKMIGEGPLSEELATAVKDVPNVEYLGRKSHDQVRRFMKEAALLVMPSIWYEGLPMTIIEAFSTGLPVVASNLGAMSTLIDHQRTGLHMEPNDPADLASQVQWADEHPEQVERMRNAARREYEERYTSNQNYEMLRRLYREVIREAE